jgi:hypothetical protein
VYGANGLQQGSTAGNDEITKKEEVTRIALITINNLCDIPTKSINGIGATINVILMLLTSYYLLKLIPLCVGKIRNLFIV